MANSGDTILIKLKNSIMSPEFPSCSLCPLSKTDLHSGLVEDGIVSLLPTATDTRVSRLRVRGVLWPF